MMPVFAVHLADGFLDWPWWVGGLALMALGVLVGCWRVSDREIPRMGVLSAAFFVASQLHIPLGAFSVHLLLNGLLGVVLRQRALPAIAVGLFLQTMLFGHGGKVVFGVNWCTMAIPALLAGWLFPLLRTSPLARTRWGRTLGVFAVALVWLGFSVLAVQILYFKWNELPFDFRERPPLWLFEPGVLALNVLLAAGAAFGERRLNRSVDFALGLFVGLFATSLTVFLVSVALWLGGKGDLGAIAALNLVSHVPVIALEGIGVGFAVSVLAKAKPEWLSPKPAPVDE